jgi:glutaminyl-tRNA synthetase
MSLSFSDPRENNQVSAELLKKHLSITDGKVVTRFPPEPNGYLHLGHCKAIAINFGYARLKGGMCYLRFDDTNPNVEKTEYIESILDDIKWLKCEPYKITYTSDYFEQLLSFARSLIKMDKAYVCELNDETIRKHRSDCAESEYRNRPIMESLALFEEMISGKHPEASMTLRLKIDMNCPNPNMRDPIAYRILFAPHHRTGDKYKVYPTYDYSHPLVDGIENITHSLCSLEFRIRNDLYRWIPDTLGLYHPPQIEYARVNVTHTVLSKRKLKCLIDTGVVSGWDDPRLPTIKGLRNKGYTPDAINDFCNRLGVSVGTSAVTTKYELLEECLRQDLNTKVPRIMAVIDPIPVIVNNLDINEVIANKFPDLKTSGGTYIIPVTNKIFIEANDYRDNDDKNFFRLAPNKIVRLTYLGLVKCQGKNENGEIVCDFLPATYKPQKRVKGTVHWVSAINKIPLTINKYSHLFPEKIPNNDCSQNTINTDSLQIINAYADESFNDFSVGERMQFERIGYFIKTGCNSANMIVPLKQNALK